jgi:hypothetical protein
MEGEKNGLRQGLMRVLSVACVVRGGKVGKQRGGSSWCVFINEAKDAAAREALPLMRIYGMQCCVCFMTCRLRDILRAWCKRAEQ